jgi:alpha-ribazole phosphatase
MKLILIRHGNTEASEKHLYCGSTDLPLSDTGRAALLERNKEAQYPCAEGLRVLTSGMKRCEETLALLYGEIPHETDAAFREMDCGIFEMRSYEEMKNDPDYLAWITGDNEANVCPGGESGQIMTARVLAGLDRLLSEGRDTLLITHGGVIAAIMTHLFPEKNKNRYEWQPKPGGGYEIELGTEENRSFRMIR